MKDWRGMTIVEIMVVVVIIGVLASLTVPRVMISVSRRRAETAANALGMIHAANQIYRSRNGVNFCPAASGCSATEIRNMNGSGSVALITNGYSFFCDNIDCSAYDSLAHCDLKLNLDDGLYAPLAVGQGQSNPFLDMDSLDEDKVKQCLQ